LCYFFNEFINGSNVWSEKPNKRYLHVNGLLKVIHYKVLLNIFTENHFYERVRPSKCVIKISEMKKTRIRVSKKVQRFLLTTTAIASMIGLLVIQVNWLMESIKMQEAIFAKGVNMALSKTAQDMAQDVELNSAMQSSIERDSLINSQEVFTQNIISRLDSTVQKELEFYHINLDFHFLLINGEDTLSLKPTSKVKNGELFHQTFTSPDPESSIDLAIHFPERSTFIAKRIWSMFAASVLLIIFNLICVILILGYYLKERSFAAHVKDMIGNLTHEFMTPISSISLAGNMILSRSQKLGDQTISQFATAIKEENKKLQRQVDRLLQLAAVENSGFDYNKSPVNIHDLINEAITSMSFQLKQNDGDVECSFYATKSVVSADSMHMVNVFMNLISNGIKYSVSAPFIRIETSNVDHKIQILVIDKGIGIPSREYKRIFEKYYRISTGNMHNTKGFGIGLYYVKTVIKAHQGVISVKSRPDEGSVFCIILPVCD
jgi:two-component system, OmpR family, phosphate regulon sensor histidine kinase PhoR